MTQVVFYRYTSDSNEIGQITSERKIKTKNPITGATWFTTDRFETSADAQKYLALPNSPTHRVGPIPADEIPDFDIPLRPVAPANSQPGGGVEARTKGEVYIFGLYEFNNGDYLPLHKT